MLGVVIASTVNYQTEIYFSDGENRVVRDFRD